MANVALIAGDFNPRVARFFAGYARRLIRKKFHALRLAEGSEQALSRLADHRGPAIIVMSHASWWDPLVGMPLWSRFFPGRSGCAPMDARQLEKFGFFRRLGIFGLDPDDPRSLPRMIEYVSARFADEPRGTLWITPQGQFTDPRVPTVLRPGAAAIAARTPGVAVVALAVEYAFWQEPRPEIFVRAAAVAHPAGPDAGPSTAAWHRALTAAMEANRTALAELVIARDARSFRAMIGAEAARVHPIYDLWLRLRGRRDALTTGQERRRLAADVTPTAPGTADTAPHRPPPRPPASPA